MNEWHVHEGEWCAACVKHGRSASLTPAFPDLDGARFTAPDGSVWRMRDNAVEHWPLQQTTFPGFDQEYVCATCGLPWECPSYVAAGEPPPEALG